MLYGRTQTINQFISDLTGSQARAYFLTGPSGIGKTAFVRESIEILAKLNYSNKIYYREISGDTYGLRNEALDAICFMVKVYIEHYAETHLNLDADATIKDISRDFQNFLSDTNHSNFYGDLGVLFKLIRDYFAANIQLDQATVVSLFVMLLGFLDKSEIRIIWVWDRVEHASLKLTEFFSALIINLPNKWSIVFCVNNELPKGVSVLDRLLSEAGYKHYEKLELLPLTIDDVDYWYRNVNKKSSDHAEIEHIHRISHGRPLFVNLMLTTDRIESERFLVKKVQYYYKERLALITETAKKVLTVMSLFPASSYLTITELEKITSLSIFHLNNLLLELEAASLICIENDKYR